MSEAAQPDSSPFKKDLQELKESVEVLKDDMINLAHSTYDAAKTGSAELRKTAGVAVDKAKHKLDDARHLAADAVHAAKEKVSGAVTSAKETAVDAKESVEQVIVDHPLAAVAVAAGVGFMLGMLLSRSRR